MRVAGGRTKDRHGSIWLWAGICMMVLTVVPGMILGEDGIITYHDQLDSEAIGYLLQARHLFSGDKIPEFMGGSLKTAITMPAPICVLLFLGGNVWGALTVMQLVGRLIGFVGMYLLSKELTGHAWIGGLAGALYGLLPYLPVYGLSQYGIGLLVWCALQLRKGKYKAFSYGYTILFGLASSLVLSGAGLLGLGGADASLGSVPEKEGGVFFVGMACIAVRLYGGKFSASGSGTGIGAAACLPQGRTCDSWRLLLGGFEAGNLCGGAERRGIS